MTAGDPPATPSSFSSILAEEQSAGVRKCELGKTLDRMEPALRGEVVEALGDDTWTAASIARTLQRFDHPVTEGAVRRCRRICDCWRDK